MEKSPNSAEVHSFIFDGISDGELTELAEKAANTAGQRVRVGRFPSVPQGYITDELDRRDKLGKAVEEARADMPESSSNSTGGEVFTQASFEDLLKARSATPEKNDDQIAQERIEKIIEGIREKLAKVPDKPVLAGGSRK